MSQQVWLSNPEFYLRVAQGLEPRYSYVEKFGENPDVDTGTTPEDVWSYGGSYTFSSGNDIDTISSSNTGDTQDIVVEGLTSDYTKVLQTATLNGQNKVVLSTPLWRCFRAYNDGTTDLAGTVYIYEDDTISAGVPTTATKVRATIANGDNQTEMAVYTVPGGKCGYFLGGYVASSRTGNNEAVMTWRLRLPGKVFRVQSRLAIIGAGSSSWQYLYPIPVGPIPAGSDIKLTAESVDANNTGLSGGFTILLEDV